jgi:magnesium transporter
MRTRAFAQNTCATTDRGIFLDSASDLSARLNLVDGVVQFTDALHRDEPDIEHLYTLRRDLLRLRNAAGPLVEVCSRLEHSQLMPIDKEMQPHFRDVTDHVRRVREEIDALREVLAFAFEASLMAGQAQQTVIARRLAAWAAILAVPTAIAGIYGMDFEYMPELKWAYGYFLVIGVIIAICTTLYVQFRRNGWL